MKKNLGSIIGILGWGVGWGFSWAIITAYHESVTFGFYLQSTDFYIGWYFRIVGLFVLGWTIAGFSTGFMLNEIKRVSVKTVALVGFLWGLVSIPLGLILSTLYGNPGGSGFGTDSAYAIFLLCFYIIIVPIGFGFTGYIGGYLTLIILKRTYPSISETNNKKWSLSWGFGLLLGVIIGLLIIGSIPWYTIPYIGETHTEIDGSVTSTTRVGIWSVIYAVVPGLIRGFFGGVTAGSIGNFAIRKYLNNQALENHI